MKAPVLAAALALACGCGKPRQSTCPATNVTDDGGVCAGVELAHATGLTNPHVPACDDSTYSCGNCTNPPLGGPHCPTPLACRIYTTAQSRCAWIHNLEHGHLVLAYNCPGGCPDVVQQLTAIWNAQPVDGTGGKRVVLTPDPLLPRRVAAMVWGWSWVGDSVDANAIACLASHEDQDAPEAGASCAQ